MQQNYNTLQIPLALIMLQKKKNIIKTGHKLLIIQTKC